jgi:multidrug transporter EmrE-like cation transporter
MSNTALALVLTAGLLHALWNIAAKKSGGDHRFSFICCVLTSVMWLPVAFWFGLREVVAWSWVPWAVVMASAVVHTFYFNVLLTGYRKSDLTVVYPVARGTGPLIGSAAAVVVLGESVSLLGMGGVLAVCAGIFLVAGGVGLWARSHDPAARAHTMTGVRWGFLTGCLIACYTVIDGYAIKVMLLGPVVFDYLCNALRMLVMAPGVVRDRSTLPQVFKHTWKHALLVATLGPLAYILVLTALQTAPLSHVAPAREVSMLFAALIGGKLLGEHDRGARVLGACCMAAGVMALAWA